MHFANVSTSLQAKQKSLHAVQIGSNERQNLVQHTLGKKVDLLAPTVCRSTPGEATGGRSDVTIAP